MKIHNNYLVTLFFLIHFLYKEKFSERVEEKEGIPPAQQRLIFSGKQLNDEKKVAEYKIQVKS